MLVLVDEGYINASYINHHDAHFNEVENKKYISTQGPLPHTIEDFWEMITKEVCRRSVRSFQLTFLSSFSKHQSS